MVVVGKIEGKRPNFPPVIGLGQQPQEGPCRFDYALMASRMISQQRVLYGRVHQGYI